MVCVLLTLNTGSTCQHNDRHMQMREVTDLQRRARLSEEVSSIMLRWDEVTQSLPTVQFDVFLHWR